MDLREDRLSGTLLGMAVGDALGLPREGLSPQRARRLFGDRIEHRLLLGRGLCSDDTEHACMTGQALLASGGAPDGFARSLSWRLRGWLLGLPAGVGYGTLRAILKLCLGWRPATSGVASAGNGPAMRAPIIGACLHGDPARMLAVLEGSTRMTHRDPRAHAGALAIAVAASHAARLGPEVSAPDVLADIGRRTREPGLLQALASVEAALAAGDHPTDFAARLGLTRGVSGFMLHTVPVVLHAWLRRPTSIREVIGPLIALGGDTDTTAAIAGALVGTTVGASALPAAWLDGICDWPRSVRWIRRLARALASAFPDGRSTGPAATVPLCWPALLPRNALMLAVVLCHGLRRLLPPY